MSTLYLQRPRQTPALSGGAGGRVFDCVPLNDRRSTRKNPTARKNPAGRWVAWLALAVLAGATIHAQQSGQADGDGTGAAQVNGSGPVRPVGQVQAERFLADRGWGRASSGTPARVGVHRLGAARGAAIAQFQAADAGSGGATWQQLGPTAVQSLNFGLVTGRVSSLALDPSDTYGNTLYVGTTGGGVWRSQNADTSNAANVGFIPLTDNLPALSGVADSSISIGALSVEPGGTGVILAGTGDPNDALDSYYGAGILRSTDGGNTWSLIPTTADLLYSFAGSGFAGFAWGAPSTSVTACGTNPVSQYRAVAAVSQAADGLLVDALLPGTNYSGLFYSTDNGQSWCLSTITDGAGQDVQGPNDLFAARYGNPATSVVWNPVRKLFVAAVRYHGYYQSSDGITWTRMASQPGAGLLKSSSLCPANTGSTGSTGCPIFRGVLAVNPQTGDTFAWTVADFAGEYNYDLGIWQDQCSASGGSCSSQTISFAKQWSTTALENSPPTDTSIANGDYNLTLAAVPSGQDTLLMAGANDLWKCSLAMGCVWRNTTNSTTCMSAKVGKYQHALAWNAGNPLEIFVGNDSGLWRSIDAMGETASVCSSSDATHFQNLNGGLGPLAEVVSISQAGATPYTMMASLGTNGTAAASSTTKATPNWPEILGGEGGPVAIDPANASNWYVNNGAGVSIHLCTVGSACSASAFGASPVVTNTNVGGDGVTMTSPAPFLVDPLDPTQLLIGSCRLWRGPASGVGWSSANIVNNVSPTPNGILDGTRNTYCSGDALIRSMAAQALPVSAQLPSGGEVVYLGMHGSLNGGTPLGGHVFSSTYNKATSSWNGWLDVTSLNRVSNDPNSNTMNSYGLEISSIFIDPHDTTGQTLYTTVAGIRDPLNSIQTVYRSTDGGVHWTDVNSNLPESPANSLVVDPSDAGTVYLATDVGVYSTQQMLTGGCNTVSPGCWAPLASGLPEAPVVALSAQPTTASSHNLIAATYGRGIWMTPLLAISSGGSGVATDTLSTTSISFPDTSVNQLSPVQYVTLTNSGSVALLINSISISSNAFQQSSDCTATLAPNSHCTISVQFLPATTGLQTATLSVYDSVAVSPKTVALSGSGIALPTLGVNPSSLSFSSQIVGQTSSQQTVTITNTGGSPLANPGFQITGSWAASFAWSGSTCGAAISNISGQNSCTVQIVFTPLAAGAGTAQLVVSSTTAGVSAATVTLNGLGTSPAGVNVNPSQLSFPIVSPGQTSLPLTLNVTNSGSTAVNSMTLTATPPFSLVLNTCGSTLAGYASCSTGVVFSPSLNGPYTGTLTIASPSLAAQAVVSLSGVGGVPGSVQAQPSQIVFQQTGVGLLSNPTTVTITNPSGTTDLSGFTLVVSAGFRLVSNNCSTTLAAGASCTAAVAFAPTNPGVQSGNLTVGSSALTTGAVVPLTGMGYDFSFVPSGSPSQTIANGQTAYYKLVITPLLGGQGIFTFMCGTLPSYASCTFNPTSEGVLANTVGNVIVGIATGLTAKTARATRPSVWPVLPLSCGLLLLPLAFRRRRKALLLVALLALLTSGVSSCTQSSGGLPSALSVSGPGITPAAPYSIVVTATSNGISHQITLALTVD